MRRELALENLAVRPQLAVWKARQPRPRVTATDRISTEDPVEVGRLLRRDADTLITGQGPSRGVWSRQFRAEW
jgi:hypothetical protein